MMSKWKFVLLWVSLSCGCISIYILIPFLLGWVVLGVVMFFSVLPFIASLLETLEWRTVQRHIAKHGTWPPADQLIFCEENPKVYTNHDIDAYGG